VNVRSTVQNVPKQVHNGESPSARTFQVRLSRSSTFCQIYCISSWLGDLSEEFEESGCYVLISVFVVSQEIYMYKNDVTLNVSALGALPIVGSLFSHPSSDMCVLRTNP